MHEYDESVKSAMRGTRMCTLHENPEEQTCLHQYHEMILMQTGTTIQMIPVIIGLIVLLTIIVVILPGGIFLYAWILIRRRPIRAVFDEISREPDFVSLEAVPHKLISFILHMEDKKFYEHKGYSPTAIKEAFLCNLRNKALVYGGSTITQQLVKNLYLSFRKSYVRKLAELFLAVYAERKLSKNEILTLYVNTVYYGNGIYGISHCARFYFQKSVAALTVNQMFMMSCMICAPTRGNPLRHPDEFEALRNEKLRKLSEHGMVEKEEFDEISSYRAAHLDDELREADDFIFNYPQELPKSNYRFGPHKDESRVTIP